MMHTDMLMRAGRLIEVEAAVPLAVRDNVCSALIEIGAVDAAGGWADPVSGGEPDPSARPIYEERAKLEMLRGNLEEAHQRWAQLRRLPPFTLAHHVESDLSEIELQLWMRSPELAYDHAHALLTQVVRAVQANHGALSGTLLTHTGPLLGFALRACGDLAEQHRAGRNLAALATARRQADLLSDVREA